MYTSWLLSRNLYQYIEKCYKTDYIFRRLKKKIVDGKNLFSFYNIIFSVNDSYGVLLSMKDNTATTINLTMIIKNLAHDLNDAPATPVLPKTPSKDQLTRGK